MRFFRRWRKKKQKDHPIHKRRSLVCEPLESRILLAVNVSGLGLVNDTGASSSDLVTSDPSLEATVQWDSPDTTGVSVEFDHNCDGVPEG